METALMVLPERLPDIGRSGPGSQIFVTKKRIILGLAVAGPLLQVPMRTLLIASLLWLSTIGLPAAVQCPPAGARRTLEAGNQAPDFVLPGSDGRTYRLSDYRGRQTVVLAWFAKAFTGG
jgi:hypothetical protein